MLKQRWILFLTTILCCSCVQKKKFSIAVTYEKQYCGGARPTPEIIKEMETPVPYANKTMVLKADGGKSDTVRTDNAGALHLTLKRGTYRLFEYWRYNKTAPGQKDMTSFDRNCLSKEWNLTHKVIVVDKDGFKISDSAAIVQYCEWRLPCLLENEERHVPD